ncbi:MAG: helix-turn-helix transcriptional regulator [Lachnospiraceae bacterium]|nr:helix-turn-helix transcriptional regulator [Lachnospiraceae bacterium]
MDYRMLGKRIRKERLRLNLTQEQLSEDIEISTAYLGQIERGERSLTLDKLVKLANRLGVTVDYLLSDSVSISPDNQTDRILQLLQDKTTEEKEMAFQVLNTIFRYQH